MQVTDSLVGLLDKHYEWLQYNENSGLGEPKMFPQLIDPLGKVVLNQSPWFCWKNLLK